MDYAIIRKPQPAETETKPNLTDYAAARKEFDWDQASGLLDGLAGGGLNLAHEAIDRHANGSRRDKAALLWEGKDGTTERYSFGDLQRLTNRFANVLTSLGVEKGDRVFTFLDRIPEIYVAAFGTLKAGAVIGPLFSAFGPDPVRDRLLDSGAKVLVTSPSLRRRIASILPELSDLKHIIIVSREKSPVALSPGEVSYDEAMAGASDRFETVTTTKDDYSIIHYTSGTTGKPKGAVHAHGAALGHLITAKFALDLQDADIYWCTADPGWVTGTSYGMSGPWTNGVTQVVYEGGFGASAWYSVLQRYKVTVWYTAPTAIRMLMKAGEVLPGRYDLSSLRHVCSVGEPLNPEAVVWGQRNLGLPIHDNWWQTETGNILIANYPVSDIKPGSMGKPFPGITAAIIDDGQQEVPAGVEGHLAIRPGWPAMFRTYWKNNELYESRFKNGWYITGDKAKMDEDGYFWFVGRVDDVINTAGHLVGPFEVESALLEHPAVAEAGVIGKPDPIAMEVVKAFVALKEGYKPSEELRHELMRFSRQKLAAAVAPREIDFLDSLPKTRSGKIMRRLLKARELGLPEGDTSTLEED
ncbi:MAG: acetate--CoA ligase [Dehalococcoidia bacterium]|nr:acetate--CoA ligase [Dehalococcoidia bacterium]